MKQKPVIILDFDEVLFDTEGYKVSLYESVKPFGVTNDVWQRAYVGREADEAFGFRGLANRLAEAVDAPIEAMIEAMARETSDAVWYLFADARPFLEAVQPNSEVYLLTYGNHREQKAKIAATGIGRYFKDVIITDESKALNKYLPVSSVSRAIFINDNVQEMLEFGGIYRWSTHLHINRYDRELPADFPFPSFRRLADALPHVQGLVDTQAAGQVADGISDQRGYATE